MAVLWLPLPRDPVPASSRPARLPPLAGITSRLAPAAFTSAEMSSRASNGPEAQ